MLMSSFELSVIYMAGGGIEGVIQAPQEDDGPPGFVTVCRDLAVIIRQALIDGRVDMVISHSQEWMVRRLVEDRTSIMQAKTDVEWRSKANIREA